MATNRVELFQSLVTTKSTRHGSGDTATHLANEDHTASNGNLKILRSDESLLRQMHSLRLAGRTQESLPVHANNKTSQEFQEDTLHGHLNRPIDLQGRRMAGMHNRLQLHLHLLPLSIPAKEWTVYRHLHGSAQLDFARHTISTSCHSDRWRPQEKNRKWPCPGKYPQNLSTSLPPRKAMKLKEDHASRLPTQNQFEPSGQEIGDRKPHSSSRINPLFLPAVQPDETSNHHE